MRLQLDFDVPQSSVELKHGDKLLLLGSCFSDSLAPKFENAGFEVCSNPLGTLFHPHAIENVVLDALNENFAAEAVVHGDVWLDWRASSKIFGYSEDELRRNVAHALKELKNAIRTAKVIVITFGTTLGYIHENAGFVGNCHKQPQREFLLRKDSVESITSAWQYVVENIRAVNPKVQFVFTVSPVRHKKDGLVENNRSKAPLILACAELEEYGDYFPSYEIVTDVLRDYRFFKNDLVHPNDDAIDVVWDYARQFFFSAETQALTKEVEALNQMRNHRSLHPNSEATKAFEQNLDRKLTEFKRNHSEVYWKA